MTIWDSIGTFFYEQNQLWFTIPRLFCFAALVLGYFFGMFQSAFLISKAMRVDIYSQGSGNAGTTNMLRVLGPVPGAMTFVLDIGKAVGAILLTQYLFIYLLHIPIDPLALKLYTGLGVILGHNFPAYLQFRGGKGVAVTSAIFIMLGEWKYIITGIVVFFLIAILTRLVSLASMTMVFVLMVEFLICTTLNVTYVSKEFLIDTHVLVIIYTLLTLVMHHTNIKRLLYGEESRFSFHRNKNKEPEKEEPVEDAPVSEEEPEPEVKEEPVGQETIETEPVETETKEPELAEEEPEASKPEPQKNPDYRTNHNKATPPAKKKKKHSTTKKKKSKSTKKKR